jgi:hypothetical protein
MEPANKELLRVVLAAIGASVLERDGNARTRS